MKLILWTNEGEMMPGRGYGLVRKDFLHRRTQWAVMPWHWVLQAWLWCLHRWNVFRTGTSWHEAELMNATEQAYREGYEQGARHGREEACIEIESILIERRQVEILEMTLPPWKAGPKPDTAVSGERPPARCSGTGGEILKQ